MSAKITGRRQIYSGKVLTLELRDLQFDDGRTAQQEVIVHQQSVGMVPVDDQGLLLLFRQFRSPADSELLEIPAGSADPGESSEAAAQRELQEEVGVRADHLTRLGGFYLAPGYCDEFMTVYLAEGLNAESLEADADEQIEIERLSLDAALKLVGSGGIQDVKTIAALMLYVRRRPQPS
jgi:ADP-ribose pyrophosphatase